MVGNQDNMRDEILKTEQCRVNEMLVPRPVATTEATEMPGISIPVREGVEQVDRVDNKNTALPKTLSDPSRVYVKDGVLDIPRPASTAADHDGLREQSVEAHDESVQVDEELIGQVVDDIVCFP